MAPVLPALRRLKSEELLKSEARMRPCFRERERASERQTDRNRGKGKGKRDPRCGLHFQTV